MNEKLLIAQVKNGNQKAFKTLYDTYYKLLVIYANQYVKDSQIAENVTQDIFVMFYEKREQIEIRTSLKAFMYTALRNHCLNYLKKESRLIFDDDSLHNRSEYEDESIIAHVELAQKLYYAIDTLPKKNREIFKMSRFEGKTNGEIAENMGITKRTVETHISNALKKLRNDLSALAVLGHFIYIFFTCFLMLFVLYNK